MNLNKIVGTKNKIILILSILFMTFVPFVAADLVSPATPFGRNVPLILQWLLLYCIDFVINGAIIFACIKGFEKHALPKAGRVSILKIALITIIGFVVDAFMLFITLLTTDLIPSLRNSLWSQYFSLIFLFVGVGVLVALASYFFMFKNHLEKKHALISAVIFGVLSNPAWMLLFASGAFFF